MSTPARHAALLMLPLAAIAAADPAIHVEDTRFLDHEGREILLRGLNVGEKSSRRGHVSWHGPEDFAAMRDWGLNAIRLQIFWSAIEPAPGEYNDEYLAMTGERIAWARDAGLRVILDMHQDLYSEAIPGGNGAPEWAVLTNGQPHANLPEGAPWSAAYLLSPALHAAFDNFWNNAPGPGDVGIQDRFAGAWRHVAAYYAAEPAVIGLNILNEPFPGGMIAEAGGAVWRALPRILRGYAPPGTVADRLAEFEAGILPEWLYDALDDTERFRAFVDALAPLQARFEKERLAPMYARVSAAIREVNQRALLLYEPSPLANFGVPSTLEPIRDREGRPFPRQALIPHAYDIVTDTPHAESPSPQRLELIFRRLRAHADNAGMAALVGEWGAFYAWPNALPAAQRVTAQLIEHRLGDFYWDYHPDFAQGVFFPMIQRPYPEAVAGRLLAYALDFTNGAFSCTWEENPGIQAPTRVYLPENWHPGPPAIEIDPPGPYDFEPAIAGSPNRFLRIPPAGARGTRTLTIHPPPAN